MAQNLQEESALEKLEDDLCVACLYDFELAEGRFKRYRLSPITKGIKNFGNSCFINATLIAVFNLIGVRNLVWEIVNQHLDELNSIQQGAKWFRLLLKACYSTHLDPTDTQIKHTRRFVSQIYLEMTQFKAGTQYDAHEFLLKMLEKVDQEISLLVSNNCMFKKKFNFIWNTQIKQKFICDQQHINEDIEETKGILLDISSSRSLEDAMKTYFQLDITRNGETIACKTCNDAQTGVRFREIQNAPPTFTICLKRFQAIREKGSKICNTTKILGHIEIPMTLDMNEYWSKEMQSPYDSIYALTAVIFHEGFTAEAGHYTCMAREPVSKTWSFFDDDYVAAVLNPEELVNSTNRSAYVLMYERQEPSVELCWARLQKSYEQDLSTSITNLSIHEANLSQTSQEEEAEEKENDLSGKNDNKDATDVEEHSMKERPAKKLKVEDEDD